MASCGSEADELDWVARQPKEHAGGVYDSTGGCVKGPDDTDGKRTDDRRPNHVTDGTFLVRTDRQKRIQSDGVLGLVAWDRAFGDNQGHYRLIFRLVRSDAVPPDPIILLRPLQ
jgi:hypothetical protein